MLGAFVYRGRSQDNKLLNPEDRSKPPALHPLARSHPETGRLGLHFDSGKILRVEGLDKRDSNDLLDDLTQCMIQPQAEYHHEWAKGDVVIWDNRSVYHKAAADYLP